MTPTSLPMQNPAPALAPWPTLKLALHQARSPLTVIAYATELLLESSRPLEPRAVRQHLESIHRAAHEATACIGLLSRGIEVEQAGSAPQVEPVPVEDFRDPKAQELGPVISPGLVIHADPRLARHLAASLWEMASNLPPPRPRLVSASISDAHLVLQIQGPESFLQFLDRTGFPEPATRTKASRNTDAPPPFAAQFLASILLRALELLGGRVEPSLAPGTPGDLLLVLPDLSPRPRRRKVKT